jgi:ribosomal-protein-alanine N-acetyltransferase
MKHSGTAEIESRRLILRRFRDGDADDIFDNWASDDEAARFWSWDAHRSVDETKALLKSWIVRYDDKKYYHWAIVPKETGRNTGFIYLTEIDEDEKSCSVHFLIGRSFWNRGLMTEALTAVLDFARNEVGFEKVRSYHHTDNAASGRVMEKAGMRYVKTEYRDGTVDGEYRYYVSE